MNLFVANPEWGWWIILYFYLGGIAAGAYFLATLIELWGRADDQALPRIGYRLAFPLVAVCGILLIVDLERPERFWHMLLQSEVVERALDEGWPAGGWGTMLTAPMLKWWSPMSIGAWALFLFGACSFLSFVSSFRNKGYLVRVLGSKYVGGAFHVVATALGFFLASYTGVLLTATNQPLWSDSVWIGPLFLTSAASTGMAATMLLARWRGGIMLVSMERLERADMWALGLEGVFFVIFLASLGRVLDFAVSTWAGAVLIGGTALVGLFLPIAMHLKRGARGPRRMIAAAVFALVGGFLLRYGIVAVGPAILERFGDSPALLQELSRAGTGTPSSLVHVSPEDNRQRGGAGASFMNRPTVVRMRSKFAGTQANEPR